ncbi:MAG TPA: hypothetical protein VF532_24055 [Candidatus Angelobacter sp.]
MNSPKELERVLSELGLPPDFELNSLLNLLPAHSNCNSVKTSKVFRPDNARFFLERAASKEASVRRNIDALKLQNQKDRLLSTLHVAIESGELNLQEIHSTFRDSGSVDLQHAIEFADGSSVAALHLRDVETLLDKPVLIGGSPEFAAEFVSDSGGKMVVRTCREYRAAKAGKYYALTTYDIKSEAFLKTANAVLEAVARAKTATVTYVSDPYCGVADLQLLPKELLPVLSQDDEAEVRGMKELSLSELARRGEIEIVDVSSRRLDFKWRGLGAVLSELLRADLDGDGVEELLVQYYAYAVGGTFGHGDVGILSRGGYDQIFKYNPW